MGFVGCGKMANKTSATRKENFHKKCIESSKSETLTLISMIKFRGPWATMLT